MKLNLILLSLLLLLIAGCDKQQQMSADTVWKLNPTSAQKMDLTQIVDSIYLLPLETNEECLIKKIYSIDYVDNKFYINNNQMDIQVYDHNGKYLYGTGKYLGNGPRDYTSALSFRVLKNDTIEIFDAISRKMRHFIYPKGFVSSYEIPKEVLPACQYEWLNRDTCVFSDGTVETSTLKIYSRSKNKVIKKMEDKQKTMFVKTSNTLYKANGNLYFSAPYPSNELYVLNEHLDKDLVLQLDFGQYNFFMKDLPEGMSSKFYYNYIFVNNKYAYPYSKYLLGNLFISYFQFGENLYVAYMNKANGKNLILKNEKGSHHQFMIPHSVCEGKFLYASEPGYLPYLIDKRLMSDTEIEKIKDVGDMDNPIIIIYKMKNE